MVSTRRQVINEQDRYGGFEESKNSRVITDNAESGSVELYSGYSGERTNRNESAQGFTYTVDAPRRASTTVIDTPAPKVTPRPAKRSRDDLMPRIETRRVRTEENRVEAGEAAAKFDKVDKIATATRTKVILAVYVAAVIFLAAIVIITGVAVANSSAAVTRLESEFAVKNEMVLTSRQELEMLSNDTNIRGRASEMSMENIDVKDVVTVELSEGVTPTQYASRTNAFDKFCDWLSGILN